MIMNQKIVPFLMFEGRADEAINFYMSLFRNSEIKSIVRYGANEAGMEGKIMHASFTLNGQEFMAIDSSIKHGFSFTPSISLYARCDTIEELDELFEKLSDKGQVLMPPGEYPFSKRYAWISDKFGVSWQLSLEPGGISGIAGKE